MLFTTGEFAFLFLPVVAVLFYLLGNTAGRRPAILWLVIASLLFYGAWRPVHVPLLLASIVFNYLAGRAIQRARAQGNAARSKTVLIVALTLNLALLMVFKYAAFLVNSINTATGAQLPVFAPVLPLGISFFTFTQIAYLVDAHVGKVADEDPGRYGLFVTYFPHLIAGPVLHHSEMMPQFASPTACRVQLANITPGLLFYCAGMFKKVIIADSFAPIANALFGTHGELSASLAWLGALAYALQIYFDFSGYSDMAVGLSLLFNVRLPYNFNSPYKSLNIVDFWRRWHMTLSRFLRDYLYIPLGGNRHGVFRQHANLMVTMLLGGLWHGASWCFVVWGGLHGTYLIINHAWGHLRQSTPLGSLGPMGERVYNVFAWALTMVAVLFAWVFFRMPTLVDAWQYVLSMIGAGAGHVAAGVPDYGVEHWSWVIALLLVAALVPNTQTIIDGWYARQAARTPAVALWRTRALLAGACVVLCALAVVISQSRSTTEFIYFNF